MCGIAGIVFTDSQRLVHPRALDAPLNRIQHRGPDGEGRLVVPGVAGGMRRLAIIDVTGGDQPISNEDGSISVLFNGEIYNHEPLRDYCSARGHHFRTRSDTEVLVHLYEERGVDMLDMLDGMFGFIIWDAPRRRALLARDRYGVKPLYLCPTPSGLAFASEVKALQAMGVTEPFLTQELLGDYLRYMWIPEPRTAWKGVTRMAPGSFMLVEDGRAQAERRYFRPVVRAKTALAPGDVTAETDRLLREATRRQLVADVPVGAFLSGGLDSSLLVAHAVELGAQVPAHTIRIDRADAAGDPYDDDSAFAADVARALGLDLRVYDLRPDLTTLLPRLMWHADDPISDPSIINTYLICEAARSTSKVLLSGMGADEVNGGYRRHTVANFLRPYFQLPRPLRALLATGVQQLGHAARFRGLPGQAPLRRAVKAARALSVDIDALVFELAQWTSSAWIARVGLSSTPADEEMTALRERVDADWEDPLDATMAFDIANYLPSHNLHVVDKMSMAASVEVRVPFLDNELAAFLSSLPHSLRVSGATGKVALRRAARGVVPDAVLRRPKTGFGAPIRSWLRGPLRPLVDDLLSADAVRRRGLLNATGVTALRTTLAENVEDVAYAVWALLCLEQWCRVQESERSTAESPETWASAS